MIDTSTQSNITDGSVSVVGLGKRGQQIVQKIKTQAPVKKRKDTDANDTEAIVDSINEDQICLLTGDLDEPGVTNRFTELLSSAQPYMIVLPEGSASEVSPIAEHAEWLIPFKAEGSSREWIVQTIQDLCESVVPPTACELGPGDLIFAGADRVGRMSVTPLEEIPARPNDTFLPEGDLSGMDSFVYFFCMASRPNQRAVESAMVSIDLPNARAILWDYRIHPRYAENPHVKQIFSSKLDTATRIKILQS